eukprot:scaffold128821_cov72-Phaeocystis_antarctica.AAC.3
MHAHCWPTAPSRRTWHMLTHVSPIRTASSRLGLGLEVVCRADDGRAAKHVDLPRGRDQQLGHVEAVAARVVGEGRVAHEQRRHGPLGLVRLGVRLDHRTREHEARAGWVLRVAERLADGALLLPPEALGPEQRRLAQAQRGVGPG